MFLMHVSDTQVQPLSLTAGISNFCDFFCKNSCGATRAIFVPRTMSECHRRCFCCGLFLLSMFVRFLFSFALWLILFRIVLWPSVGKELSHWLFHLYCLNFKCFLVVLVPFPFDVWVGCGTQLYWLLIITFLSTFQSTQASLTDVLYTQFIAYYLNVLFQRTTIFSPV